MTVCYTSLAVARMTARRVEVLVGVSGLGVEVCGEGTIFFLNGDIKEVGLLVRVLRSELDGPVERINMVNKCEKAVFIAGPDEKYIVNVSPPDPRTTGRHSKHLFFKSRHKETGQRRCHPGPHRCAMYL